mgnify:CR=1 FL=1
MHAFDISNFTGVITDDQAKILRDEARKVVVNVHDPDLAIWQINVLRQQCMEIELYVQTYFSVPLSRELDKATDIARQFANGHESYLPLWLSFEDAVPTGLDPDVVIGWIQRALFLADYAGFHAGIYTRENWWREATGDTSSFSTVRLWVAQPDGVADLLVYNGFGGWFAPTMKQYAMDVTVAGLNVDRDVY